MSSDGKLFARDQHTFDKAGCAGSIEGWKAIQAKYLNK